MVHYRCSKELHLLMIRYEIIKKLIGRLTQRLQYSYQLRHVMLAYEYIGVLGDVFLIL
jgi:hypothetical protein